MFKKVLKKTFIFEDETSPFPMHVPLADKHEKLQETTAIW